MNNDINVINDLDMSIWGLILEADFVVRLVMLSLLFLSIFSWSIIFEKLTKLRKLRKQSKKFEDDFWSGINIEKFHESIESSPAHPMEAIFVTGMKELTTSYKKSINYNFLNMHMDHLLVQDYDNMNQHVVHMLIQEYRHRCDNH